MAQNPEGLRKRLTSTRDAKPVSRRTSNYAVAHEWVRQQYPHVDLQGWRPSESPQPPERGGAPSRPGHGRIVQSRPAAARDTAAVLPSPLLAPRQHAAPAGHAFISYVREDSPHVDRLQQALEAARVPVWRDTADLWPGEDWRAKIRHAITGNALVFLACFSTASLSRARSYQNEELALAIDQMRLRRPGQAWLIPVRFDDCDIPEVDIGGGRLLASIQRADLFGARFDTVADRLVTAVLRILRYTT